MSAQKSLVGFNIFYSFNLEAIPEAAEASIDTKFRQATVWALDRHTLVDDVLGGVFKVPDIMNHWIAPWANSDKLEPTTRRTSTRQRSCWPSRLGTAATVIQVCALPTEARPGRPGHLEMWEDVGIKTKSTPIPDADFVKKFYTDTEANGAGDQGPLRHRVRVWLRHARRVAVGLRHDARLEPTS